MDFGKFSFETKTILFSLLYEGYKLKTNLFLE